jgi:predicted alpha/beta hydrolase family esterase
MKRQVLFIQGGGKGAYDADGKLVASLRRALGANYQVNYPEMPDEDDPDYGRWKPQIKKQLDAAGGEIILVGHSLGGYFLIKYLSEEDQPKNPVIGIALIAVPYPGGDEGWHYEGFSLPKDFATRIPKDARIFLYHSRDDRVAPFAHVALYAKELTKATVRETIGGHQLDDDLSVVAEDIRAL